MFPFNASLSTLNCLIQIYDTKLTSRFHGEKSDF